MTEGLKCLNEKSKRDIFRFNGEKPTAINLEHVTMIVLEGNKLTFSFHMNGIAIDIESEEAAKAIFEQILCVWAGHVLE
jgi:hypothetical protein